MHLTIPEFTTLTKQQLFDRAIEHITETGTFSFDRANTTCSYKGSGCNAAPFLTAEGKILGDDLGSWGTLVREGLAPDHEYQFIAELQAAHDGAHADVSRNHTRKGMAFPESDLSVTPEQWRPIYAQNMFRLGVKYELNIDKVRMFEEKYGVQPEA